MRVIDDRAAPDRSHFLLEVIRRTCNSPAGTGRTPQEATLQTLIQHLDRHRDEEVSGAETIPLPLPQAIWIDTIFSGRASAATLVADILRSRGASLLYYGLLALDDDTRAWLAAHPGFLTEIMTTFPAAFVAAAPVLRVRDGSVAVPGGAAAEGAWTALTGSPPADVPGFVRALLGASAGRLAYFYGSAAYLTQEQMATAFRLDGPEVERVASARRLVGIFERLGPGWLVEQRAFWRPASDPSLLLAGLASDDDGRPLLPAGRGFWEHVFDHRAGIRKIPADSAPVWSDGDPADFGWLAERVFEDPLEQEARFQAVLFASRLARASQALPFQPALDAVRAVFEYPALVAALERAGMHDVDVIAAAARRATILTAIRSDSRRSRALAQYQGTLALLVRASARGAIPRGDLPPLVASLAALDVSGRGEYEGRLVRWLATHLPPLTGRARPAGGYSGLDDALLRVAAAAASTASTVEWEGMRYRVDFAFAERIRLARLLGPGWAPHLSLAAALVDAADAADSDAWRRHVQPIEQLARAAGWIDAATGPRQDVPEHQQRAQEVVRRLLSAGERLDAGLARTVRESADALVAASLMELAYAAALGEPERIAITAVEAASRHEFGSGTSASRAVRSWQAATRDGPSPRAWRLTGALLGMELRLAEHSLVHVTSKPPPRRPSLNEQDRRAMIEAVALVQPPLLSDRDRDAIAGALRDGRARVARATTSEDARALADALELRGTRRTLLDWIAAHDRPRLLPFFSTAELLRLGLSGPPEASLHAWGAPARPRLGCDCLQLPDAAAPEAASGRWHTGMLAAAFPDLNLRLAELLAGLGMPAPLLGPVLAPATLDFVNTAISRDADDRRGPLEFVQQLPPDRLEQYLALLTTDGPLVPVDEAGAIGGAGDDTPGGPR